MQGCEAAAAQRRGEAGTDALLGEGGTRGPRGLSCGSSGAAALAIAVRRGRGLGAPGVEIRSERTRRRRV
jgi:hypothetical protein